MVKYTYILLIVAIILEFTACDKLPQNDELEGMWHLQQIVHKDEVPERTENIKEKRYYWSFQLSMLQIYSNTDVIFEDKSAKQKTYIANCQFFRSGYYLDISKVYLNLVEHDSLLVDPNTDLMERFGIVGNSDLFFIEHLGSKQMTLVSDEKRLFFRKF